MLGAEVGWEGPVLASRSGITWAGGFTFILLQSRRVGKKSCTDRVIDPYMPILAASSAGSRGFSAGRVTRSLSSARSVAAALVDDVVKREAMKPDMGLNILAQLKNAGGARGRAAGGGPAGGGGGRRPRPAAGAGGGLY